MALEVLFVCTGNVCRSPMAELIFRHGLAAGDTLVSSAGTRALVGAAMDAASAAALRSRGLDPSAHRGRQFEPRMAFSAGLILTAEVAHRDLVMTAIPSAFRRTFTLREFARLAPRLAPGPPAAVVGQAADIRHLDGPVDARADDILDPFQADLATAEVVAGQIAETVRVTLAALGLAAAPAPRPRPRPMAADPGRPRPVPRQS